MREQKVRLPIPELNERAEAGPGLLSLRLTLGAWGLLPQPPQHEFHTRCEYNPPHLRKRM